MFLRFSEARVSDPKPDTYLDLEPHQFYSPSYIYASRNIKFLLLLMICFAYLINAQSNLYEKPKQKRSILKDSNLLLICKISD